MAAICFSTAVRMKELIGKVIIHRLVKGVG